MVILEDQDGDKQKRAVPRQYLYDIVFGENSTQASYLLIFSKLRQLKYSMINVLIAKYAPVPEDTIRKTL